MTGATDPDQFRGTGPDTETELKRSIELEYCVIDSEGRLTEPGTPVDAAPGVEREFVEPLLEVKTAPMRGHGPAARATVRPTGFRIPGRSRYHRPRSARPGETRFHRPGSDSRGAV